MTARRKVRIERAGNPMRKKCLIGITALLCAAHLAGVLYQFPYVSDNIIGVFYVSGAGPPEAFFQVLF